MSAVVYRLSLRALVRGRRALVVGGLALIPVLTALGQRIGGDLEAERLYADLLGDLLIPTITAFVALILSASAIGDDRDDGTILQLVASTVPRIGLATAKTLAAWSAAMAVLVVALVASAVVGLGGSLSASALAWPLLGIGLSALCYSSVFVWVGLRTRRALVIGAVYVLLWEGTLATFADGVDRLSIAAYGRAVAGAGVPELDTPPVSAGAGIVVLAAVSALGLALSSRALSRVELP